MKYGINEILMRNWFCLLLVSLINPHLTVGQKPDYNTLVRNYIQRFSDVAVKEMMQYRIPASVTLAQGIIESNAGQSRLSVDANNHFGIKCHNDWYGKTYYQDDDGPNECFRKYDSPEESFHDHSYILTQRNRYQTLFDLDVDDYRGWAKGLKSAGYATNPQYAELLIKTIESYGLYNYDNGNLQAAFGDTLTGSDDFARMAWLSRFELIGEGPNHRKLYVNNELKLTVTKKGDYIEAVARDFDISVKLLIKYNDLPEQPVVTQGQIIYLEPKRRKAASKSHKLQPGENSYQISQIYGIKLHLLQKRNNLSPGIEPVPGTVLILR